VGTKPTLALAFFQLAAKPCIAETDLTIRMLKKMTARAKARNHIVAPDIPKK